MPDKQETFETFLKLVNQNVNLTLGSGEKVSGTIINTMFDSILLSNDNGNQVVRFVDISVVETKS